MPLKPIMIELRITETDHIPPITWALGVKSDITPDKARFKRAVEYLFDNAREKLRELLDA